MKDFLYELCQEYADLFPDTPAGQDMRELLAEGNVSKEDVREVLNQRLYEHEVPEAIAIRKKLK